MVIPRRTQADRTALARRRLLHAAITLLADHGYTGTTLGEIGREAGLSRGLVTHHFGGKDACIAEAIAEIRRVALETFLDDPARRGLAAIDHLIGAYISSVRDGNVYMRAMYVCMADAISSAPALRDAVATTNESFRASLRVWLDEAIADGETAPGTDAAAYAVLIEAMIRGVCLQWITDPDRVDLDASIAAARHMLRVALATPPDPVH